MMSVRARVSRKFCAGDFISETLIPKIVRRPEENEHSHLRVA